MLLSFLLACGAGADEEIWRFAIEETSGSVQDVYAQEFARLVEEQSDVDVKVYPYGTLGTSDHTTELLYNGSIEFVMASPGHIGKIMPEVQVFLLHFVMADDEVVTQRALQDDKLGALLDEIYAEKNFELLGVFSEGWQVWTTNKEIRTPDDWAGVKMRVMTSPLLLAAYDAYGASPTPLPYAEVYSALQLSMIDGQVNPVFAIQEMSFHEVTDWMIFAKHLPFVATALANDPFYSGLSDDRRALVDSSIAAAQKHAFEAQRNMNRERLELIRQSNPDLQIIELSEEERQAFREAGAPVREQFVEMAGPRGERVLQELIAAMERAGG